MKIWTNEKMVGEYFTSNKKKKKPQPLSNSHHNISYIICTKIFVCRRNSADISILLISLFLDSSFKACVFLYYSHLRSFFILRLVCIHTIYGWMGWLVYLSMQKQIAVNFIQICMLIAHAALVACLYHKIE